jgi:asparagine synthase (glutamine-hydrolysing)
LSGIAAVLRMDGSSVSDSEIERIANVLKPHGQSRQKNLVRGNAGFVCCLHHLTPEDLFEQQPLVTNRFVMLFDGRIDNRNEVGEALGIAASELKSMPDSLLAFRLFDRWGERGFGRIVGAFAVILMDLHNGELICARDHLGMRVLHYHRSAERFAVATTPDALFALDWVPRRVNKEKVADTLVQRGVDHEITYYENIYRVAPGCSIRVRGKSMAKNQFWDAESIAEVRFKNDNEYVEAFQERLNAAVKASLRSCSVPCATMTGGLDSSTIAVIAADMIAANVGKKLNTFTAVPELGFCKQEIRGRYYDETPYVRQIAAANPNIVPHFIPPSKGPILDQIAEQIRLGGVPSGSILNGLWVIDIYRAARLAGHSVLLAGEMGNLTMSYHGRGLFADLVRTGRWVRLIRELKASGYQWEAMLRQWTIAPFVPAPIFRKYKQWRRGGKAAWYDCSVINPDFAARSGLVDRAARESLPFDAPPHRDNRAARIRDLHCYSETADWYARLQAVFGIETRAPAFDRRVVEFCLGIPEDQYLHNGCDRWLIRRAMKGRLPDVVLYKKKYGVQAADWYLRLTRERKNIGEKVEQLGNNADVASVVDLQRLGAILDNWPESEPPEYSDEQGLILSIPQALGAAYFIERTTGANYGR